MNDIQEIIYWSAKEATGIWDIISEISQKRNISRNSAVDLFKNEINFIKNNDEIFLLKSDKLYDNNTISNIDKNMILELDYSNFDFNENGIFYHLSDDVNV